jgi:hypothetical protein
LRDVTTLECLAHLSGTAALSLAKDWGRMHVEVKSRAFSLEQRDVAFSIVAEVEILADDDMLGA